MRTKFIIFIAAIATFSLFITRHTAEKKKVNSRGTDITTATSPVANLVPAPRVAPKPAAISTPAIQSPPRNFLEESNAHYHEVLALWQAPIDFYGKVVDENSNAVAGAQIDFQWNESPQDEDGHKTSTTSDSEGLFSLNGKRGPGLDVWVRKPGYYASHSGHSSFAYALSGHFTADPLNPVIFQLRKKDVGADLIQKDFPPGIGQTWQLHHDGTPIKLDFVNGSPNVIGDGQLKLEFWRDISDLKKQPFDWKLKITTLGCGGIIPTDEEFAFSAPEVGYQPSIVVDMPATNQLWLGELRTKYYVKLPNGNYGRFNFYLLPRNGVFTVNSWVNPTGSRNLEPAR